MADTLQAGAGQNTKFALIFLAMSALFFVAAVMSLPMVLLSPASFNLYFCFGSLNLQIALAFWYGPMTYVKEKLFKEGARLVGTIYVASLLLCLYMSISGAGYLLSLLLIGV